MQLPSDVFPQAPTVQVKIDRRTDDGNLGEVGWGEFEYVRTREPK